MGQSPGDAGGAYVPTVFVGMYAPRGHEHLEPEEARRKIELHAQQSREAKPGQAPGRLAVVESEILFLE